MIINIDDNVTLTIPLNRLDCALRKKGYTLVELDGHKGPPPKFVPDLSGQTFTEALGVTNIADALLAAITSLPPTNEYEIVFTSKSLMEILPHHSALLTERMANTYNLGKYLTALTLMEGVELQRVWRRGKHAYTYPVPKPPSDSPPPEAFDPPAPKQNGEPGDEWNL